MLLAALGPLSPRAQYRSPGGRDRSHMTEIDDAMPTPTAPLGYRAPDLAPGPAPLDLDRAPGSGTSADIVLRVVTGSSAVTIMLMLAALVAVLAFAALPSIRTFGAKFLVSSDWRPNEIERPVRDAAGKLVLDEAGERVMETVPPSFGALPVIYGTAVSSLIALLFAVPVSLGAAMFLVRVAPDLSEWVSVVVYGIFALAVFLLIAWVFGENRPANYVFGAIFAGGTFFGLLKAAPRITAPVSFLVEFLAAIPSIAYGIWALFVLAPFLQGNQPVWGWLAWTDDVPGITWFVDRVPNDATNDTVVAFRGVEPLAKAALGDVPGLGWVFQHTTTVGAKQLTRPLPLTGRDMFSGGLILAVMIVPIITAISRDVLNGVPRAQVEGTVALGATWWQSCKEMLKYSRSGLFGAVMLGLARAAGETMAVTMVIGNKNQIVPSPFAPAQTMSSLLANEFAEVTSDLHRAALVEVALVLLVMSLAFNVVARHLVVGREARTAAAH